MKRMVSTAAVVALVIFLFLLFLPADEALRHGAGLPAPVQAAYVRDPFAAMAMADTSVARQPPPPRPVYVYEPPVFRAWPGELNGRPLKDTYDELAGMAESGDAEAARVLGDLVVDCGRMVEQLRTGKHFSSRNPLIRKYIAERERVAGTECPSLGDQALGSASNWYMLAAEGGDRQALLRLRFHPPMLIEPDAEAKTAKWRALLIDRLARLGNAGDFDAMMNLVRFYLEENEHNSTKAAYLWLDRASHASITAERLEHVLRMRDIVGQRVAEGR